MRPLRSPARAAVCAVLFAGVALAAGAPVKVGPLQLSSEQLALRLGTAGSATLSALSKDPGTANLLYVERVVVPALLYRAEVGQRGLVDHLAVRERDVLFRALATAEREAMPEPSAEDIRAYYDAHSADFSRPRRLRLWRILVGSEADARKLIGEVQGALGPERWRDASRKLSKDTATRERGGDLGFVHPDGFTDVPELRVDKALFEAADKVEDGALVPEPVREGTDYAVVWRRGSLTELSVPLEAARPTIVRLLLEERTTQRLDALVATLTKAHVTATNPALVEKLDVPAF